MGSEEWSRQRKDNHVSACKEYHHFILTSDVMICRKKSNVAAVATSMKA
jgi:hypothetical protein